MSKVLGIRKSIIDQKGGANECTLNFLSDLFANQEPAKNKNLCLLVFTWGMDRVLVIEFAILGHVSFPRNLEEVDIGLIFREQIKQDHPFVPALLGDTISTLYIAKTTLSIHLECCVSLLQIWSLTTLWTAHNKKSPSRRFDPSTSQKNVM